METLIKLTDISQRWDGREVLSNVNLDVNRGDFLAITGPNGGGKTTLLRIILKLLKPTSGEVGYYSQGEKVKSLPIGYLPQKNMIDSRFPITVREVITSGLIGKPGLSKGEVERMVDEVLDEVELHRHVDAAIGNLSGGQLQRALLGRAIISKPEILVLDEPLSYLDKQFEEHIYKLLKEIGRSTTIVLVSHEMSVISTMATRHLIVERTLHECTAHKHFIPTACR